MGDSVEKMPGVKVAPGGVRFYITVHGIEHGLTPLEAEWLFLALGREFHPDDMRRWFPSAGASTMTPHPIPANWQNGQQIGRAPDQHHRRHQPQSRFQRGRAPITDQD